MGPLIFNIYVADLQSSVTSTCHQYADDSTIYAHARPAELGKCLSTIKSDLVNIENWADKCNLAINPTKTKYMLISTKQLSTFHSLDSLEVDLSVNTAIERVRSAKLLGTHIDENLRWEENIKHMSSTCC